MKTLNNYTKNGYDYTLVNRIEGIAIFHGKSKSSQAETWEVIAIQSHNGLTIAANDVPPAEYPPSNEQWGAKGWSFSSLESAQGKFHDLTTLTPDESPTK
jgi:hypothetical protein